MELSFYEKFKIPEHVSIVTGEGNLPKILVNTIFATAEIYLHGAHVTSFVPAGHGDLFWVSPLSPFRAGKAIRGGVPICFPWFGPHPERTDFPAHGFVRIKEWTLESSALLSDGKVEIVLTTESDEQTRQFWAVDFKLEMRVTIGSELKLELITTNTDSKPFVYEECFHTYFSVTDVHRTLVKGLENTPFLDKLDKDKPAVLSSSLAPDRPVTYLFPKSTPDTQIDDMIGKITIISRQDGFKGTVVWTPGENAEVSFTDIGNSWKKFICLEAVNCGDYSVNLLVGNSHRSIVYYAVKKVI
jgi:D-hexose-6-phosphate mutarotase